MSLRTGAELITLSLLLNKISGLYGLLAILTGYHLNSLQLSMYIYSLAALALTTFLAPHIRRQSPLQCLALAWFYVLDTVINAVYTATFAITWFLVISRHQTGSDPSSAGPGAGTIDDIAGFTDPKYNVSAVHVEASPAGVPPGQDAVAAGVPASSAAGSETPNNGGSPSLGHGVLQPESFNSIGLICTLWTIRLYFCVIMLAYARFVLRQHIASTTAPKPSNHFPASASSTLENPFSLTHPLGHGPKGALGRFLTRLGSSYFLGADPDDASWMNAVGGRFRKSGESSATAANLAVPGPVERERRRRSGTGPPPPLLDGGLPATGAGAAAGSKAVDLS